MMNKTIIDKDFKMDKLRYAQDLLKTRDATEIAGFNMYILGEDQPSFEYRSGYNEAERMSKENSIAFTYKFKCSCGGIPFKYGGFFVCNDCSSKKVNKQWWEIKVEKDGNMFCCHGLDFINLQSSENYAFGKTFYESIIEYEKTMRKINKYPCENIHCIDGIVGESYGEKIHCDVCGGK